MNTHKNDVILGFRAGRYKKRDGVLKVFQVKIWSCNKFCYDECCSFAGLVRSFYVTLGKKFYSLCMPCMYKPEPKCTTQEQTVPHRSKP